MKAMTPFRQFFRFFWSIPWLSAAPIIISVIALYLSWEASKASKNANFIASQTQVQSTKQFLSLNKPIVMVKQVRFGEGKGYIDILSRQNEKTEIATLISIENIGSIVAGNVFVQSVTCHLFINGIEAGRVERKNKPLNDGDNLSLIHIPPKEAINRIVVNTFRIPESLRMKLSTTKIELVQNLVIYYYPDTIQTPNKEAENKLYATNITNHVKHDWYSTSLLTFLDKPSLSMVMQQQSGSEPMTKDTKNKP